MAPKKPRHQFGFTLIQLVIALVIITAAGGVVVWQKKVAPTVSPTPTLVSSPSPRPPIFLTPRPTTSSEVYKCKTDDDCQKGHWCYQGPCGPIAGGGTSCGKGGLCVQECQADLDCDLGAFCQDYQIFQGDVGMGRRKGCQSKQ